MTYTARDEWEQHFSDGKNFRQVGEREQELLADHTPVPDGGVPCPPGWGAGFGCESIFAGTSPGTGCTCWGG